MRRRGRADYAISHKAGGAFTAGDWHVQHVAGMLGCGRQLGRRTGVGLVVLAAILGCLGGVFSGPVHGQDPPVYVVNHVSAPPTIDGLLTSESEWAAAALESGGDWKLTLNGAPDSDLNRFAALWDDTGLYIQHQVNYGGWANRGATWDVLYDYLTYYFDPNTDGETNESSSAFGTSNDGYQLQLNQPLGESEISASVRTAGMNSQAYVDGYLELLPGQVGPYAEFSGVVMKQNNSFEEQSGYLELFIPWTDFDATDPNDGFDPVLDDTGLYHPQAPAAGTEWFFNSSRYPASGLTVDWSSPVGAPFGAAQRPHGILQFARGVENPCDIDVDGDCDADDIDAITRAVIGGSQDANFDRNGDGAVTDDDRVYFVEEELNTYLGDANLDGQFGTGDFVAVFLVGGYEDGIPGNSGWAGGDWNGDLDFTTGDFVAAFLSGGYELGVKEPRDAVRAVPEPCTVWLLLGGVLLSCRALRRN